MTYLASSAGALIVDRNAWHTRADQAWGASRVWNSGSSFETDLTAMTTDRNTWHTRADQAWGSSRVWNSGSSWETLYTTNANVQPLTVSTFSVAAMAGAGASNFGTVTLTPTSDPLGLWAGSNTLRLRIGTWMARFTSGIFSGTGAGTLRISQAGSPVRNARAGLNTYPADVAEMFTVPSGTSDLTFQMAADAAVSMASGGVVSVWFVPTPARSIP